jgi:hypothetical protein
MIALALAGLAPPARANEPIWQVGQPVQLPPLELLSGESIQWPALKGKYSFQAGMATAAWRSIYSQRKGLPQLFVIDRRGVLVAAEVREMMDDDIEDIAKWL